MLPFGPYEVQSVVNGTIRLDGGAMFGVVPKVLWHRHYDVDADNRILLATRTLIAVDPAANRVILVDTGCGSKWEPEQAERYAVTVDNDAISRALAQWGLTTADVTDVVITHLHFDHNGGLCNWADGNKTKTTLRYPQARHWIHRRHWDHAHRPYVKDKASFIPADFETLADAGVLSFVDSDLGWVDGPYDGLAWFVSNGHTPCQLHPIFGTGADGLIFSGDIVPTSVHVRPGWVMAYDVRPITTIEEKQMMYERCLGEGYKLAFPHDPKTGLTQITGTVKRPEARPLDQ